MDETRFGACWGERGSGARGTGMCHHILTFESAVIDLGINLVPTPFPFPSTAARRCEASRPNSRSTRRPLPIF